MVSIAMIASSCASTPQTELRNVANTLTNTQNAQAVSAAGSNYDFSVKKKPELFSSLDISKLASASNVKLEEGQLITNNDLAFDKKLELINSAQKEIRMVYFIYAGDNSSSQINQALIAKAKNGVKIKLMVDFVTNYKNLDLFSMLEREGNGNIKTYFYNVPTSQIIEDANFTVLPCPKEAPATSDACFNSKLVEMAKIDKSQPTAFAKILLSGMYGKSGTALKVALGYGAEIDPKNYQNQKQSAEGKDKDALITFAKLAANAFVQKSASAKIQLSIAMTTYSEQLNPLINELTGRLPVRNIEADANHANFWDHMTDYTHHKLLVVDHNQFQLGGRNVEDSYHMNQRVSPTGKYIFMDTDFWGRTKDDSGAQAIEAAFDKIIDTPMVKDIGYVKSMMAFDFIVNVGSKEVPGAAEMAVGSCLQNKAADLGGCILKTLPSMPNFKSENNRVNVMVKQMNQLSDEYNLKYVQTRLKKSAAEFPPMSQKDLDQAEIFYLENYNYVKGSNVRIFGSKLGSEDKNNKNIQAAWYRGLENACKVSQTERRDIRVIFNTAYLLMPSGMILRIAKMMNGDFDDCSRVRLTFITNSPMTTDLAPINVLARYQLGAIFTYYNSSKNTKYSPKIDFYELKAVAGVGQSLHTKTSLIGDDLIVGSANADVRSYYMDTNNAVLIRNAKDLNASYIQYIDGLITSGRIESKMSDFVGKTIAQLRQENEKMLFVAASRWRKEDRLTPGRVTAIMDHLDQVGRSIYETTNSLISFRGSFGDQHMGEDNLLNRATNNNKLNAVANDYDSKFKLF